MADNKRVAILKRYCALRAAGNSDELVKMTTGNIAIVSRKGTEYKGHAGLRKYLKDEPSTISPSVGEPVLQKDGSYTVSLYIFLLLNAEATFIFAEDSNLIVKIVIKDF